jgi:hypothetical protein
VPGNVPTSGSQSTPSAVLVTTMPAVQPWISIRVTTTVGEPAPTEFAAVHASPRSNGAVKIMRDVDHLFAATVYSAWEDLDSVRDQLTSLVQSQSFVIGSALTVSTGLTVGYVMWMLRGGMLLSSIVAQIPVWSLMDPLVILSRADDDDEDKPRDDDQESLQTILTSSGESPYGRVAPA